jgi:hypothetical protein
VARRLFGSYLSAGGNAVYYFHYLPLKWEGGCNDSAGNFGMFKVGVDYEIEQPRSRSTLRDTSASCAEIKALNL